MLSDSKRDELKGHVRSLHQALNVDLDVLTSAGQGLEVIECGMHKSSQIQYNGASVERWSARDFNLAKSSGLSCAIQRLRERSTSSVLASNSENLSVSTNKYGKVMLRAGSTWWEILPLGTEQPFVLAETG